VKLDAITWWADIKVLWINGYKQSLTSWAKQTMFDTVAAFQPKREGK
jgi:hypothetical protein